MSSLTPVSVTVWGVFQLPAVKTRASTPPSVTASDPITSSEREKLKPLRASNPKILSPLDGNAVRWMPSRTHHGNWLESIVANRQPIAPIQQSARSLQACAAAWISMKLGRKLTWDAAQELFVADAAANALRTRKARKPECERCVIADICKSPEKTFDIPAPLVELPAQLFGAASGE